MLDARQGGRLVLDRRQCLGRVAVGAELDETEPRIDLDHAVEHKTVEPLLIDIAQEIARADRRAPGVRFDDEAPGAGLDGDARQWRADWSRRGRWGRCRRGCKRCLSES